ncbi:SRPBCC family protein [Agrococcus lahaulensis]|uniref:SRPBCC family protein n=1 Tax=Agrococcus lahaulensis TaxID=341722 RepID=UPI000411F317|nr:SRPBCC family protein [Agrococcus lahaulensis]
MHAERSIELPASAPEVFAFLDDHRNLSAHMAGSSAMLAGGSMQLELDERGSRDVGAHVVMRGSVLGIELFLDEVVVERTPHASKSWQTVEQRLLVIGAYRLGFLLTPLERARSRLTAWIDDDRPPKRVWLGRPAGRLSAAWCVRQILRAAAVRFR